MKTAKPRTKSGTEAPMLWGGFCDGKLHFYSMDDHFGGQTHILQRPAIFLSRAEARKQFQDVRKVVVLEA